MRLPKALSKSVWISKITFWESQLNPFLVMVFYDGDWEEYENSDSDQILNEKGFFFFFLKYSPKAIFLEVARDSWLWASLPWLFLGWKLKIYSWETPSRNGQQEHCQQIAFQPYFTKQSYPLLNLGQRCIPLNILAWQETLRYLHSNFFYIYKEVCLHTDLLFLFAQLLTSGRVKQLLANFLWTSLSYNHRSNPDLALSYDRSSSILLFHLGGAGAQYI